MKNILNETAKDKLSGRTKFVFEYLKEADVINKKVLDIGCGYGWFEYNVLNMGVDHIWGLELSEKDILTAKSGVRNERVTFQVGSAIALPFEDNFFDCVVSWEVIEHIPPNTEAQMLKEINRVLKDGGVFYLSTPYRSLVGTVLDPAWWLIKHRHYTKGKMKKIVETGTKLKLTDMQVRGGVWDVLNALNMYVAKWVFHRTNFCHDFFRKKVDNEFKYANGINTLFIRGKKIGISRPKH